MNSRDVIGVLLRNGWYIVRPDREGTSIILRHPVIVDEITMPDADLMLGPGTVATIEEVCGLSLL